MNFEHYFKAQIALQSDESVTTAQTKKFFEEATFIQQAATDLFREGDLTFSPHDAEITKWHVAKENMGYRLTFCMDSFVYKNNKEEDRKINTTISCLISDQDKNLNLQGMSILDWQILSDYSKMGVIFWNPSQKASDELQYEILSISDFTIKHGPFISAKELKKKYAVNKF